MNSMAMPRDHMAMPSEPKTICICIIWQSICIHIEIYMYARSHMNMYMHISYVHVYMYESVMPSYVQVLSLQVLFFGSGVNTYCLSVRSLCRFKRTWLSPECAAALIVRPLLPP